MDTINYCSLLFEVKDQTDINSEANVRNISKFPKAESPNFLFRWWVNIVNVSKFLLQLKQLQDLSSGEFRTSMQRIYFLQVPTVDASWPVLELSKLQYSRMSSCWCPKLQILAHAIRSHKKSEGLVSSRHIALEFSGTGVAAHYQQCCNATSSGKEQSKGPAVSLNSFQEWDNDNYNSQFWVDFGVTPFDSTHQLDPFFASLFFFLSPSHLEPLQATLGI